MMAGTVYYEQDVAKELVWRVESTHTAAQASLGAYVIHQLMSLSWLTCSLRSLFLFVKAAVIYKYYLLCQSPFCVNLHPVSLLLANKRR